MKRTKLEYTSSFCYSKFEIIVPQLLVKSLDEFLSYLKLIIIYIYIYTNM